MQPALLNPPVPSKPDTAWLDSLRDLAQSDLRSQVEAIDREGSYPRDFMHRFGELGGFSQSAPIELGGGGRGLKATIQAMELVSAECLSTGFCVWCQTVCGWYLQNGDSDFLRSSQLPDVLSGRRLAGTGLSNPMKHFAGIEEIRMAATPADGGYRLNGALPWVSNVGPDHLFCIVARIEPLTHDEPIKYLMAATPGDAEGLALGNGGEFIALEGSSTYSCLFRDVFVGDDWILASPCESYLGRIRAGFILTQTGFGLGLVESCIALMKRADRRGSHVNCFLPDGVDDVESDLHALRATIYRLADEIGTGSTCADAAPRAGLLREVIEARAVTSELSLRASQAAMLYTGASGYRLGGAPERKLRESYFVAIVTPALKHLRKLLSQMPAA